MDKTYGILEDYIRYHNKGIIPISIDPRAVSYNEDDPFSHWSDLIHKSVYSIDGKKLGFFRKVLSDYMFISSGFINLTKYFVPITLAESVSKRGIRLKINAYEAKSKYSYSKMTNDKKRKILFVDDEPDMTSLFRLSLKRAGFDIDTFNDPLLVLKSFKPN